MPKTVEIQVYTFAELSDKAKEEARKWWRDCIELADYADSVEQDYTAICDFLGFTRVVFQWHGFSSQGDGAMFTGLWSADKVDVQGLLEYAPQDETLHKIAAEISRFALRNSDASAVITQHGRYSHEHCAHFECEAFNEETLIVDEALFIIMSRELMRAFYGSLEASYNYANSGESVDDSIEANEYEFMADGSRYVGK